ncbi:MAG: SufS family cysteine desulfurase [Candidatus Eisenbacteria bacterium]|nr:SufS family cysteine desulfurase [Candidatus Latescibacterota bacterium]MBD3302896.1 SufS family cysteine desulfurase [Candidatus Eisenbacteria bacterium]
MSVSIERLDVRRIRSDFPILGREVHGHALRYLDNAATTQKPRAVLDALRDYYERHNSNVHRGVHTLAQEATEAYEGVRTRLGRFLGGVEPRGIVFTRNTTEAINLVARSIVEPRIGSGDEILLTEMEHHSNLVPWIQLAKRTGARLRHVPITEDGRLDLDAFDDLLTDRTKLVAFAHASNVLGTINPVERIAERARAKGALTLLDAAQSIPHMPVDARELGVDLLAASAHKMLGPTGVGFLWGRPELLEEAEPMLGGGEMILEVHLDRATWADLPQKLEAGTPNVGDVVAFGAALNYLEAAGLAAIRAHEVELTGYALERLRSLENLRVYGPEDPEHRSGVISFYDETIHPHDLATMLDLRGIAIRAGHHCAQPLMRRLGVPATSRASFYLYNERADVDALVEGLEEARSYFG